MFISVRRDKSAAPLATRKRQPHWSCFLRLFLGLGAAAALSSCQIRSQAALRTPSASEAVRWASSTPTPPPTKTPEPAPIEDLVRRDDQGAVSIAIEPLAWPPQARQELGFQISMDTHSVDLSMDLSKLSTLESDLGLQVSASSWSGGSGHHVQGTLLFPASTADGRSLLEGARSLVLTIREVDAPERVFRWELPR